MIPADLFPSMVVLGEIGTAFALYLREHPVGRAGVGGVDFHPENDPQTIFSFDLAVVLDRNKPVTRVGAAPFMPDIVAEVQSPDRTLRMMADRATIYLANGVRVVVLIYPATRTVEVVTADDTTLLTENDTLTLDLLPGFAVPVKSLFSGI